MTGRVLQSTLREVHEVLRSKRLWATFVIVVLVFVITGPFGTVDKMGLAERLAFWFCLHAIAWLTTITVITAVEIRLAERISHDLLRLALSAAAAAPLIAALLELLMWSWIGRTPSLASYGLQLSLCLVFAILFSILSHLTVSAPQTASNGMVSDQGPEVAGAEQTSSRAEIPLIRRLRHDLRGPLLHLTIEDHYTVVTTIHGQQLLLLRFSDALAELGSAKGLQVHRSHWVADHAVDDLVKEGERLMIRLKNGQRIPVSRRCAAAAKVRYQT
ncbi:LytTR family transcriptional regulator [Peteryoungia desertarenae]|uniref:LytTR family transcriptional regulator n=1 Tax=Peteryoungia desertarenae TaxID=1813451 RepID=A0ABX6QR51_9HYPH|nr:LytTR family DNA-binding domain-containing protein [Peteryoungia desertarenae]QLF70917.1 LytTR family transcriptional regulator [Peteryoungia desertarenae]